MRKYKLIKMFDVDKLYTYHYSTKEIIDENGKPKIVKDDSKSLYNDLLDLHLAVFDNNNQELYKLILSPNGFGKLKTGKSTGLSFEIDEIKTRTGRPDYNFLSAQYQMAKFFNGTSGKAGVGVFSSLSMLNAISQGKGMRYVDMDVDRDGNKFDKFNVRFGGLKSDGQIGDLKTLDGGSYVSKVIEAFQSASVDNEKEQILYKLNINRHTFNTINALAMLGFDESVICYFINQPIIEEYVKRMADKDSSLNKFTESSTADVFGDITKEFQDKYSIIPNEEARDFGAEQLKKELEVDSNLRDGAFWAKQLAILKKFSDIDSIGKGLQSVMQTVNAESKGLGKTLFGSLDRQDKIDKIDEVSINYGHKSTKGLLGAEKILYEVDKDGQIVMEDGKRKSNSLNGFVAEYGTSELNKIGRQILPYDNKVVKSLFDLMKALLNKTEGSINANEEFMSQTFTAMKSYMFSNTKLFGEQFDIEDERKRLFMGIFKTTDKGRLEVEQPSLPDIIDSIKDTTIGESNALLRSLIPDLRMKSSELKLIKYTASAGQNLDESELHQAFISLFREDIPLEFKIGNRKMEIQSRKLAEDLIKYVYLSGGTQEAIQFTRYIPIEVLIYMGFGDVLKDMASKFDATTFGIEMNENNIENANVLEQIIQHSPKKVPVKVKGLLNPNKTENLKSGIKNVQSVKLPSGIEIITSFELALDAKDEKNNTGAYMYGQQYIAGKFDKSKNWMLYKKNGDVYESIPVLGTFGVSEFNYNLAPGQIAESIIPNRNLIKRDKEVSKEVVDKDSTKAKEPGFKASSIYDLDKLPEKANQIELVLNQIISRGDTSSYHKSIADNFLKNTHLLATLSKIPISYATISDKGLFTPYKSPGFDYLGKIEISTIAKSLDSKDELDRVLLHEIEHAYTLRTLRQFEAGDKSLPQNVVDACRKIDALRRSLKYKFKQNDEFKKSLERVERFLDPETKGSVELKENDAIAYGLSMNGEFITMATENPVFRNAIDGLSSEYPRETPFLSQLWDALLNLLGLQNTSQITKDYITQEIFQFVNEINKSLDKVDNNSISLMGRNYIVKRSDKGHIYSIYEDGRLLSGVEFLTMKDFLDRSFKSRNKPEVIEGFKDNEKYRKVQEALDSMENLTENIVENPEKSSTFAKNIRIAAKGQMTFNYGNNARLDIKSKSTIEAIRNGERTATTRYEDDGHIGYWKNLKIGDIVEFSGKNGEKVLVEITIPLHKLNKNTTANEWSKKEGWSEEYFNSKVKPKLSQAWQMEYKVIDKEVYSPYFIEDAKNKYFVTESHNSFFLEEKGNDYPLIRIDKSKKRGTSLILDDISKPSLTDLGLLPIEDMNPITGNKRIKLGAVYKSRYPNIALSELVNFLSGNGIDTLSYDFSDKIRDKPIYDDIYRSFIKNEKTNESLLDLLRDRDLTDESYDYLNSLMDKIRRNLVDRLSIKESLVDVVPFIELVYSKDKLRLNIKLNELSSLFDIGYKNSIKEINYSYPSFQENVDLTISKEELKLLEAKHGENALNDYNQLSDEEKEYIIKCLR